MQFVCPDNKEMTEVTDVRLLCKQGPMSVRDGGLSKKPETVTSYAVTNEQEC